MSDTFICTFDTVLSEEKAAKVNAAVKAIDPRAYCVAGWTEPKFQQGWVAVEGELDRSLDAALIGQLRDAINKADTP